MPTTILKTSNGVLDAADQAALADLLNRLGEAAAPLHLHLHGGLVDEEAGLSIARRLAGPAPDGFGAPAEWEQVFVVWRTGAIETIRENWTDLFDNDRLYKALLKKLLDYAAGKLGVPSSEGRSVFSAMALTPSEISERLEARPAGDPFADVDTALEIDTRGGRGPVTSSETDGAVALEFTRVLEQDLAFNTAADDIAAAMTFDPGQGRSLARPRLPCGARVALAVRLPRALVLAPSFS